VRRPSRAPRATRAVLRCRRTGRAGRRPPPPRSGLAAADRRRGDCRLPALLVPRPEPRAGGRRRAAPAAARRADRRLPRDRTRVPRIRARLADDRRCVPRPGSGALPRGGCRTPRRGRASGGGSVAWIAAGGELHVGTESAGAQPGPACYGLGGTRPTVTDANLLLGRVPERLAGGLRLDRGAAERALGDIDPLAVVEVVN